MAILRKPYEISVWEDELIPATNEKPSYYKENKIMVIGTDEMTSPNKAFSPVLTKNVNGEVTLTFSMAYKYFDPASDSEVINPFVGYLINERKIKLFYDNEWYDFIIVDHQEDSESMVWQYTAKDALVNELSKNGYNIEFSTELGNNQGTAIELAKATLKNTDWQVDEENSDLLVQKVNEPMVRMKLTESGLSVYDIKEKENTTIDVNEEIYVFYSYIANKEVKYVQFMRAVDKPSFTYDDNENIIGKNYRILSDVTYTLDENEKVIGFSVDGAAAVYVQPTEEDSIQTVPLYTANQGYRIVYGPLTTYDPVMERTVERYEVANLADPEHPYEIYKYSDSDYTTSNVITPLITNGSDFNIYENGSIQGWSNANLTTTKEEGRNKFQHLSLTSYPELKEGAQLVSLTNLTRIQGFLEMKFDNPVTTNYENTYFNSGFMDNAGIIDHISGGEEFVFRISAAKAIGQHDENLLPLVNSGAQNPDPGIHAIVAYYTEPNGEDNYLTKDFYRQVDTQGIILEFGSNNWVIDNPTVTGGYFSTDEHDVVDYKNYIINNVVQEPTTNSVYKVEGSNTEYVWDSKQSKYVVKDDTNFINYYRTIASVKKPVTNTKLTDPTVKIGIFLYTTNNDLCTENVYTYISDVQITRCVYDANEQPITIGNIPTTTVTDTPTYYIKPKEGITKEQVDVYYTLAGVANSVGKQESDVTPIYNEDSEKILSISEAQSNCFNILQTICETFECWLKIEAERDEYGGIIAGSKKVLLKEYAGKDNFAGFKYAINLKSIQRTLNSEEIVTKLIVDNVQSDYTDDGVMSIRNASSNPSGEAYILNLNYYINKGLIKNGQDCRQDMADYYAQMKELNTQLNQLRAEKAKLELALNKLNSDRNVYTELISAAKDQYNEGMVDFKEATGMDYNDYVDKYGSIQTITSVAPIKPSDIDRETITIPTNSLVPLSNEEYEYRDSWYGFGVYNNEAFYADFYTKTPLAEETDEVETSIYRLFIFQDGAWVFVEDWSTQPSSGNNYNKWKAAYDNRNDEDHGASKIQNVPVSLKLDNYGYAYYDGYNYLGVRLMYKNNVTNKHYHLYRWNDEDFVWELIYNKNVVPSNTDEPDYSHEWSAVVGHFGNGRNTRHGETTLNNGDLTEHEAIIDIIGQLYVASSTINNYAGILSNLNQEYEKLKLQVNGAADYTVTISSNDVTEENNQTYRYSRLMLSDYIDGSDTFEFYFHKSNGTEDDKVEYKSNVSTKTFEVYDLPAQWYDRVTIASIPQHYSLLITENENESNVSETPITINILSQSAKNYQLVADEQYKSEHPSLQENIDKLQQQKDDYEKAFYSKYYHYIKEGTWSSNDYVDAELYYLDALQTSANSAMPKVEYSIDVAEVSELEGLENYIFNVGDKTYVEDTEFFGWHIDEDGVKSPAREEVIVSQVEWHLDEPETNVITVQNYKTRFEDLFQRLSATVQTVQYNEATYAKTSSILDENGTLNQNLLVDALNTVRGSAYALTSDGSVAINGDQIWIRDIQNLTNSQNIVRINSEGIGVSTDAGQTWATAINGRGINAGLITVGNLNADEVTILDGNNPSFRWDKYGISAYKYQGGNTPYDLTTYVRLDQYGLYGVKGAQDYHATSLANVKEQAQFGLTWDGFFIKNSYEGGGLVQITSDNDFQVINGAGTEKIKIGALEWTNGNTVTTTPVVGLAPSLYGIRINNDAGQTVFKTGDDGNITITGIINATGGNFSDLVTVGKNQPNLPYIAVDGTNASMYSSNYQNGAGYGWMINKDGDAVFNNITARGAIKTAVFEYAEIQAVGGVFIFRPSSTIKGATQNGNDLIVSVEKPLLFQEGSWCKVSNFTENGQDPTPEVQDILRNNGLSHVYKISSVQVEPATEEQPATTYITLQGAAAMVEGEYPVTTVEGLIGGALVNMGYKEGTYTSFTPLVESNPKDLGLYEYNTTTQRYVLTEDTEVINGKTYYKDRYESGIHNYGVGINSSDNTVNLPARAISLFETQVDETQNPKVTYKYRGILGTLPQLPATSVNTDIYRNMVGTQGIYTDNIYLGDLQQYLAFYTDENGNKKLKISAAQISFEIPDEHGQGSGHYQDVADIEAEGVPGPPGEDAVRVEVDSTGGNFFRMGNITTNLIAHVYKGTTDITTQVTSFDWYRRLPNGDRDTTWVSPSTSNQLPLTPSDVDEKAVFVCKVIF